MGAAPSISSVRMLIDWVRKEDAAKKDAPKEDAPNGDAAKEEANKEGDTTAEGFLEEASAKNKFVADVEEKKTKNKKNVTHMRAEHKDVKKHGE